MDIRNYQKMALPAAFVFFFVMLFLIVFWKGGLLELDRKKTELKTSMERNEEVREENRVLFREVTRLKNDHEYIEQVARKELGMIKKNEIIVNFHSGSSQEQKNYKEKGSGSVSGAADHVELPPVRFVE